MRRTPSRLLGILPLPGGLAVASLLAACGGPTAEAPATPVSTQPAPSPTATRTATPTPTAPSDANLLAQGRELFEETAGGVGCAWCHGLDGRGDGPSGLGAPPNRGATGELLKWALDGGDTGAMLFIKLTNEEKDAVLAYLKYLGEQP